MDVSKEIPFVGFCFASASMLQEDLGLPTEKLICLYKECIEMAKHCHHISNIITFVRFCFASTSMLQEDLGLSTEKLICLYKECSEMAKHYNDIDTMEFSCMQFVLHSNSKGRHADSLRCLKEILPSAVEIPKYELAVHECLLLTYTELKDFDNVVLHAKKWTEIAQKLGQKEKEIQGYCAMGMAFSSLARYDDAIDCFKKGLKISKEIDSTECEMLAHGCIMLTHQRMQNDDTIPHAQKLLDCAMKTNDQKAMATAYLELGRVHEGLSDYDNAIIYCKKCIELAITIGDKHAEARAYSLLGKIYYSLGKYDDAISNYNKCLHIDKEDNEADKAVDAQAYFTLGEIHLSLQNYDDAIQNFKQHIDIVSRIGREKVTGVKVYLCLGEIYKTLEQYSDAVYYTKKCIDLAQETGDKTIEARACLVLSSLYRTLDEKDNAIQYSTKCIDLAQETGQKTIEAQACLGLSYLYRTLDEKENSIQYGTKCIDLAQETGQKTIEAQACLGLSYLYRTLDEKDIAIQYGKKSIAIAQEISDKETKMEGHTLLAEIYMELMQVNDATLSVDAGLAIANELGDKKAEEKFKEIRSIIHATVGLLKKSREVPTCSEDDLLEDLNQAEKTGDKRKKRLVLLSLSELSFHNKDYEKVFKYQEQMKEVDIGHNLNLIHCILFADMYQLMGQNDMALRCYEEGLPIAETYDNNMLRFHFYYGIGSLLFLLNKELNLTERYLREAIRCFEAIFTTLGRRDEFKISIFDQYIHSYKMLAILLIKDEQIDEALLVLDRCRARALKDQMITNYKMEQEGSNDEHLEYSDALSLVSESDFSISYYSICFDFFLKFHLGGEATMYFATHPNAISTDDFLRIYVDTLFDEMNVREVVNCEDRSLDKEQDIQQEQRRCIEDHEEVNQATASPLDLDSKRVESNEKSAETKGSTLEALFHILECDRMQSSEQDEVVIIPEGPLYQVPFPALRDPCTGKYLSETKRIRLAPSLATLKRFEDFPTDRTSNAKPLIIGDPLVGKVMMDGEERYIIPLPGAREEAETISKLLNTPALLKEQATKLAVIKRLQEGVSVVHIAAHGILSKATIVLAPSDEIRATKTPDEEDYMLTMADVQQAKVRAQLVVLSCCHSGRGEIRAEGVVGMCRAFLVSGARAVVGSLWAIDDDATLEFMTIFYGHLKNGKSASTSLQLTMNEMRNSTDYKELKYWAPFFLMGDDITLQL